MRPILVAWSCALLSVLAARPALAANGGVTALPFLSDPIGARSLGLGGAYDGVADDLFAVGFNPAGLAVLRGGELAATLEKGLQDSSHQFLAAGFPLPMGAFPDQGPAVVAASGYFSGSGSIEVNRTNPDGSFLSSDSLSAGSDMMLGLSIAQRLYESVEKHNGDDYRIQHFLGLTGKYIHSTLAETASAHAFALDGGYMLRMPEWRIGFGLSVLNLGGKLTYVSDGDPLPTTYRAGLAYTLPLSPETNLLLATSAEYRQFEDATRYDVGAEYSVSREYFLRGGYQFNSDTGGLAIGFGLREGSLQADYAFAANRLLGAQHHFSVQYRFTVPWARPRRTKRLFIEDLDVPHKMNERKVSPPEERIEPVEQGIPGWIY